MRLSLDARLYRTGDQARFRADGAIEFLGRLDQQLKVMGHRVEPGEIETALCRHTAVEQAVVLGEGETSSEKRLIAYVVPAKAQSLSPGELKTHLTAELPAYMIPATFAVIDELPLTPNGKVDLAALRAITARSTHDNEPALNGLGCDKHRNRSEGC